MIYSNVYISYWREHKSFKAPHSEVFSYLYKWINFANIPLVTWEFIFTLLLLASLYKTYYTCKYIISFSQTNSLRNFLCPQNCRLYIEYMKRIVFPWNRIARNDFKETTVRNTLHILTTKKKKKKKIDLVIYYFNYVYDKFKYLSKSWNMVSLVLSSGIVKEYTGCLQIYS